MSRNKQETSSAYLGEICSVLCAIQDVEQMHRFLEEILTPAEQKDLALRWELMRRLMDGDAQRQIAEELGVSLCKITRGARILKQTDSVSKQQLMSRRRQ